MLLAEANQWPEDTQDYFGDGDECHMAFHFPLMPRMYMAIAQEDRFPITDIMRQTPEIPDNCQWAIFLRNHDELTLEMVTDRERDYLWETYAADRRARINLGIRRRLAPLLERDRRRIELMNCLLLSMPGTPVIYYGDEIGMGDNIYLGDRDGVRTPMQWSPDRNGGFSRADPARAGAAADHGPALRLRGGQRRGAARATRIRCCNWMRRMLAVRREHQRVRPRHAALPAIPSNRKVLAYLREHDGRDDPVRRQSRRARRRRSSSTCREFAGRVPVELIGGSLFPPIGQLTYLLTLPPYGFYWFVLRRGRAAAAWHTPAPEPMPDFATFVLRDGLAEGWREPATAPCSSARRCPPTSPSAAGSPPRTQTHRVGAHRLRCAAARRRRTCCSPRSRSTRPTGDRALAAAARHRLGGRDQPAPCRSSSRWPACAAAAVSAC